MEATAALVIHPGGNIYEVNLKPGRTHLELMREHLDCQLVDVISLTDKVDMWVDDEGMYNHPINPLATRLARRHGFIWQPYHGPVLLCSVDDKGDSVDLDADQLKALLTQLADLVA